MNDNQPLEPQKIPSRHDKIENEIGSKDKWYKKIWNHPWLKKIQKILEEILYYKTFLHNFFNFHSFLFSLFSIWSKDC